MSYVSKKGNIQVRYTKNARAVIDSALSNGLSRTIRTSDFLVAILNFDCQALSILNDILKHEEVEKAKLEFESNNFSAADGEDVSVYFARVMLRVKATQSNALSTAHCLLAALGSSDRNITNYFNSRLISIDNLCFEILKAMKKPDIPYFEAYDRLKDNERVRALVQELEQLRVVASREPTQHDKHLIDQAIRQRRSVFGKLEATLIQLWRNRHLDASA